MTPETQALLAQMRDIHLPDPPGIWPLALGWWWSLAVLSLLALGLCLLWQGWMRSRLHGPQRHAAQQLKQLRRRSARSDLERSVLLQELSVLLRRVVLSQVPRDQVAPLTGELWLHFLDRLVARKAFSKGDGRVFALGPFQPPGQLDEQQMRRAFALVDEVIQRLGQRRV